MLGKAFAMLPEAESLKSQSAHEVGRGSMGAHI